MTELEKLDAGLPFDVNDPEVDARNLHAVKECQALESIDATDRADKEKAIRTLLGKVGKNPNVLTGFLCDNGLNIEVDDEFLANYNVTILDTSKVIMGDNVWIGPNTLISTINHPLNPAAGSRKHLGISKPIHIGNDVWIGGNATILPGVTIDNVVVAAGAVVTKDIPDNTLVGGVPARKIRDLEKNI
ncbi:MAG: DapH/DapD/GlmU-related protein [Candidatus Cryptobacteroides sp.]